MKKIIHIFLALAFAAISAAAHSASPDSPEATLHVTLGKQHSIALKADANGRLKAKAKGDTEAATVTAMLKQTTATPFPVKGDPTRPYLVVTNGFEKPIHFRLFAREKGSSKFVEVHDFEQPVPSGKNLTVLCWESGSLVEEVKLSDFSFKK